MLFLFFFCLCFGGLHESVSVCRGGRCFLFPRFFCTTLRGMLMEFLRPRLLWNSPAVSPLLRHKSNYYWLLGLSSYKPSLFLVLWRRRHWHSVKAFPSGQSSFRFSVGQRGAVVCCSLVKYTLLSELIHSLLLVFVCENSVLVSLSSCCHLSFLCIYPSAVALPLLQRTYSAENVGFSIP